MKRLPVIFFMILLLNFAAAAEKLTEDQKLQNLQQRLADKKQKLAQTKAEEQAVLGRLVVINKELTRTQNNLAAANKKIQTNQAQIGNLAQELRSTEKDLNYRETKLLGRLKEVYKSSGLNYIELLIASQSMSDFLNRLYFFRKIIDYDGALVGAVRRDAKQTRQKKESLQTKTQQIQELAGDIALKKAEIASQAEAKEKVYQALKQRRQEFEAQVAELEKSSKEMEVLILKKMASKTGAHVVGTGQLAWPLQGRLTSSFGYRRHPIWGGRNFHTGQDIAAKYGTPVSAADAGEVIFAGWWDGYGKAIVVDHGRHMTTIYAHLSRIYKNVGSVVTKGQVLGLVGSTGYSTGPHLHFEVRINGKPLNPMRYL